MQKQKTIVIIGATSAIAKHCARIWLKDQPLKLILVGRDSARTESVASDLRVRSPESLISTVIQSDFHDTKAIQATVEQCVKDDSFDTVLIAHGMLPNQSNCQSDIKACQYALEVNAISPVLFAEAFLKQAEKADRGTIAIIGSVAGDRGRQSNYIYGAAKGLIERYVQGLQHRFAHNKHINVVLIKPGPTLTPMTASLSGLKTSLASVDLVSKQIISGIKRGYTTIYTPNRWRLIMFIITSLPTYLFHKTTL